MSRRDPFDEIEQLFDQMSQQFERASESVDGGALGLGAVGSGVDVDVRDAGDRYVVTADLPGCESDDVDVRLEDDTLHVDADFETGSETAEGDYIRRERTHRSVSRAVTLPRPVDADGVTATCRNGVLTVDLPKAEPDADATAIDVE
jgi:HSP20 family protein